MLFGDLFYMLDGRKIRRGEFTSGDLSRLPAVLDNNQTVCGDLIPSSSWGSSLANLLTKKSWDTLRHPLIEKNNHVCQLCGCKKKVLDVHEVWSYDFPKQEDLDQASANENITAFGLQTLQGLMTICKKCHECFHLGLALVNGRLDIALERLAGLNCWDGEQVNDYYHTVVLVFWWRMIVKAESG